MHVYTYILYNCHLLIKTHTHTLTPLNSIYVCLNDTVFSLEWLCSLPNH